jgi:hypothetical protein
MKGTIATPSAGATGPSYEADSEAALIALAVKDGFEIADITESLDCKPGELLLVVQDGGA